MTANVYTWVKDKHPFFKTSRLSLRRDGAPLEPSICIYRNSMGGENEDPFILETPYGDRHFWSLSAAQTVGYNLAVDLNEFYRENDKDDEELDDLGLFDVNAPVKGPGEPCPKAIGDVIEDNTSERDYVAWAFFGGFAAGFLTMLIIAALVPCA